MKRFWDKVEPEPTSGCYLWAASRKWDGYGQFRFDGQMRKAHRVAWTLVCGDPGELHVLHKCDNRLCVNTDHMYLGTHQDNMRDRTERNKQIGRHCAGERHWMAALTNRQASEIREKYAAGGVRQQDLADEYGTHQTTVSRIVRLSAYAQTERVAR